MESSKLVDFLAYLLWFCLEHKDMPRERDAMNLEPSLTNPLFPLEHHGLCRALSYIVQSLSSEPGFGPKLSEPLPTRLGISAKWTPGETIGDFFVTVRAP